MFQTGIACRNLPFESYKDALMKIVDRTDTSTEFSPPIGFAFLSARSIYLYPILEDDVSSTYYGTLTLNELRSIIDLERLY